MKAYIHKLEVNNSKYIYDVNTNRIVLVNEETFLHIDEENDEKYETIKILREKGLLSENRVKSNYNPITDVIEELLETRLSTLLLQVTQDCNFRCEYCIYSGKYGSIRSHSKERMSEHIMKKSIDFLISNSSQSREINVGFYGGEPLINFALIKQTVEYVKEKIDKRNVNFSLTTNASLMSPAICEFFVKYNFKVNVSIDGDEKIQNSNRKYLNGQGTFGSVIENLNYMYENYPDYYVQNFSFNAVIDSNITSFQEAVVFFSHNKLFTNLRAKFSSVNMAYDNNLDINAEAKEENVLSMRKMETLYFYMMFSGQKHYPEYNLLNNLFNMEKFKMNMEQVYLRIPEKYTHSGLCVPGIARVFVNINGAFLICEKVDEQSEIYRIGDYVNGLNVDKVINLLNMGKLVEKRCKNCWAIRLCDLCVAKVDLDKCDESKLAACCENIRKHIDKQIKTYIVLDTYGMI